MIRKDHKHHIHILLFSCILVFLTACSQLPLSGPQASALTVRPVTRLDATQIFAADPAGLQVAVAEKGLLLVDLSSGSEERLSPNQPSAIGWSPNGRFLGAAFPAGADTTIKLFSLGKGIVSETLVQGRVAGLFVISDTEVLAAATKLETFKFGTSCQEVLYRWHAGKEPKAQILHETTLKPLTLHRWGAERISQAMLPVLSPLGDELLYGKVQDPPAFEPYLKFVIRNLRQNAEREIVSVDDLGAGKPVFAADGEEVVLGDVAGKVTLFAPWSEKDPRTLPLQGHTVAISSTGRHLLVDGHLYRNETEIATFPSRSVAAFLADGRLLLSWETTLYLVEGIEQIPAVPAISAERAEQLRTIRAWRSGGLITPDEFNANKERVLRR